jgi:3-oxoacid CoA-transferase
MDLVSNPSQTKIVVTTDHVDKNGRSKIVQTCSLPLTGARVVSTIITDIAVFEVDREKGTLTLTEVADGHTLEEVKEKTDATFAVAEKLGSF